MFLLDSNVFITAFRSYYAFHFTPGFWDWLKGQHFAGNIASVQNVRHEITQKHDGGVIASKQHSRSAGV